MRAAIKEFKAAIQKLYGQRLKEVVLYGSWARDEATAESDIDLIVVLAGDVVPGQEIDRMIEVITEINLAHNVLISVFPISEEAYATVNSPLLINVRNEGIPA
jgi:predicted nucleotidyltransferase